MSYEKSEVTDYTDQQNYVSPRDSIAHITQKAG